MGIGIQNSEPRIINDSLGKTHEIELVSYSETGTGRQNDYDSRTKQRIIHNEILEKKDRFLNVRNGEREEAFSFLREKIKNHAASCVEIWLWDPFLNHQDIIDTLYFAENSEVKMKCITSYKKYKDKIDEHKECDAKAHNSYENFKHELNQGLINRNHVRVHLDFRAVHDNVGFDFHDRFLFFIPKDIETLPTVFSLGTSVNGMGKSHHLIQQTLDPRNIIETFNELWELLDNDESKIIVLPEALHDR
jgi:hypothetical protein